MTSTPIPSSSTPSKKPRLRRPKGLALWLGLAGVVLVGVAIWFVFLRGSEDKTPYRTEAVAQGDVTRSVSASGALEALVTVQVGSQLSGQVTQVLVDYNDHVRKGQVMAILDPQTQRSSVEQSQAQIQAGQAAIAQAQANVQLAQADFNRQKFLFDRGIIAQAALDTANATLATTRAGVRSAQAQVAQQQAALRSNQANLGRTSIVAPIDGVVIDRQIEPGQTVASGLNVAVLFTLAQDLSRVQALIKVDEADIGSVKVGQAVRFTVDAFPNDNFVGQVTQIRVLPEAESSVVAYTVVAEAANPGEKLLPGMTANAEIILEERRGVLRVPNSALRFTPADVAAQTAGRQSGAASPFGGAAGGQRQGGQGGGGRGNRLGQLAEQLNLDAAQKAKVDPILAQAQVEMRAAFQAGGGARPAGGQGGGGAGGGQRRRANPAVAAAINKALDQIKPILRPDQQATLETLRGQLSGGGGERGTVWVLRDGKLVQVPVRTGGTDGTYTEIIGGGLKAGDQVITGGGPRPTAPSASAQRSASRVTGGGIGGAGAGGPPR